MGGRGRGPGWLLLRFRGFGGEVPAGWWVWGNWCSGGVLVARGEGGRMILWRGVFLRLWRRCRGPCWSLLRFRGLVGEAQHDECQRYPSDSRAGGRGVTVKPCHDMEY